MSVEVCGMYQKSIDATPIILGDTLLGVAEMCGDDFVCLTHLNETWADTSPNARISAYMSYQELKDDGFRFHAYLDRETNKAVCTATWNDGVFAIGALVMYEDDHAV